MYYRTCPECKANLDPNERCDCKKEKQAAVVKADCFSNQTLQSVKPLCKIIIPQMG